MLYHVSPKRGLKTLQPHVSTHKKAYVYAVDRLVTGLLFGAKHDDFHFLISTDENGTPTIYECYPDAFQKVFQGQSCSVYVVEEDGFQRGMTSWSPELVSEREVEVCEEIVIDDLYLRLLEEEKNGTLHIVRYAFEDDYRRLITGHIVDRLLRFQIDLHTCTENDERFAAYYKDLVQALESVMDGHLLP